MNWDFNRMIEDEILSKPVAKSLEEINHYDEIMGIEGACGKHKSFFPFSVKLASRKYLCRATEIHKYCSLISKPF